MADPLATSFAELLGRQPSDEERQRLYRIQKALRIEDNDALWLVVMALDHYLTLYSRTPAQLAATGRALTGELQSMLTHVKSAADATFRASAAATKATLTDEVARSAAQITRDAARAGVLRWVCISITAVVFMSFASILGWKHYSKVAFALGEEVGRTRGYAQAMDERAASAWANTPEGKLAREFAKSGSLQAVAGCTGKGWRIERGLCVPYPYTEPANDGHESSEMIWGWPVSPALVQAMSKHGSN